MIRLCLALTVALTPLFSLAEKTPIDKNKNPLDGMVCIFIDRKEFSYITQKYERSKLFKLAERCEAQADLLEALAGMELNDQRRVLLEAYHFKSRTDAAEYRKVANERWF